MAYTIAFVGNPNVGKSAWINALCHADFKVGNWPGVTVEKKEAYVTSEGEDYHFIDLPGTYSLEDSVSEEAITARYLHEEPIDLIVNVLDATNLSRNLLLTLMLRDLQIPMLIIFNFMDEVERYHHHIDIVKMSRRLQIPIIAASAFDKSRYGDVIQAIKQSVKKKVFYYPLYEEQDIEVYVAVYNYLDDHLPTSISHEESYLHTLSMRFMMEDPLTWRQLESWHIDMTHLKDLRGQVTKDILVRHRYDIISSLMKYVEEDPKHRYERSRKIDHYLLHKWLGLPIFFLLIGLILLIVFQMSAPFNEYIDYLIHEQIYKYVSAALSSAPEVLRQFLLQGILSGVGGVLVFIPLMAILYFVLSLLEESGYMARIAFLLDRIMRPLHLSGKSFVSLILGFGCNVPAIYATRTLDNPAQRRLTALLVPFMSCGARLPVYALFAAAFFPHKAALMIISIYGIGILMAVVLALLFSTHKSFQDKDMLVLELPPYRLPSLSVVLHKVKEEVIGYVRKATGIVLWAMIILWGLTYFPNGDINSSYMQTVSKQVAFLFEPLGFGNRWECVASLPGGIVAKETIVGFLDTVLDKPDTEARAELHPIEDIKESAVRLLQAGKQSIVSLFQYRIQLKPESAPQVKEIRNLWHDRKANLRAFSFMVYVLLSIPCIMTLQAIYHEYGWRLLLVSITSMVVIPYTVSLCIFQFFSLFY